MSDGWNYLVGEQGPSSAHLYHYTVGNPGLSYYADSYGAWHWHQNLLRMMENGGERAISIVQRADERMGAVQHIRKVGT